ncbi:AMP-binding protein [Rhodococcus pyridinivorans]|uniref:AMP-binding protein n=1 Tax=Rhodococcus pyridinivorans TaxID=103816 RepID=UPI0020C728F2|nr:AMP-binding protein [Rhodococcus pyridinivorans]UTM39097.1 AMP-binding protein [Rhodococcus pyridinivorans]
MTHTTFPEPSRRLAGTGVLGDVIADFDDVVRVHAENAAVEDNGAVVTYRDLAERVRVTASRYRARGFGSGLSSPPVGILVSHTPAVVEHLLGVLYAGATYCPIDIALPVARKQSLAAALGVDRLFAASRELHEATTLGIYTIDRDPVEVDVEPYSPSSRGDDPAYVLCTSGSTGTPKPVVVSRRALTTTVRALRELFAITPDDRVLQFASLGWDTCLEEILPALTAGATLVFDKAAHAGTFPPFLRMLEDRRITVLDLPTAFWHELVLHLYEEQAGLPDSVRLVVIGGERIDHTRLRQWRDLDLGHVRLLNTYGCTETTMITHAVQLNGPGTEAVVTDPDADAPIGRPLPHLRDHVTEEGELLVSGPSLATGYGGLPELTAAAFPVADHGSGPTRWFHTGDLVTRGADGLLYARGRADEQVKVLGVRVHPAEVEARLTAHPAVAGAVVVGERLLGRTSLTAYVVRTGETSQAELKRYLREHLPSQFVPSRVKFVAALAYTSSGKIDREATRRAVPDSASKGAER